MAPLRRARTRSSVMVAHWHNGADRATPLTFVNVSPGRGAPQELVARAPARRARESAESRADGEGSVMFLGHTLALQASWTYIHGCVSSALLYSRYSADVLPIRLVLLAPPSWTGAYVTVEGVTVARAAAALRRLAPFSQMPFAACVCKCGPNSGDGPPAEFIEAVVLRVELRMHGGAFIVVTRRSCRMGTAPLSMWKRVRKRICHGSNRQRDPRETVHLW